MTARDTASDTMNTSERRRRQDLAADHWSAMARTAALVRGLTALGDRYQALGDGEGREALVTQLRAVAAAGRLLLTSASPAATSELGRAAASEQERSDLALSRDVQAARRDVAAQTRDEVARDRDERVRRVHGDGDGDFPTRFLAACARDDAAGDRAAAMQDRRAAARDRVAATAHEGAFDTQFYSHALMTQLGERSVVRQAQGVLMSRDGLTAGEAFEALSRDVTGPLTLHDVAARVVGRAEAPVGGDCA